MKLIARFFALSLVVTGAVASTQIHNSKNDTVIGTKMGMWPEPTCAPGTGVGGSCGMGQ